MVEKQETVELIGGISVAEAQNLGFLDSAGEPLEKDMFEDDEE